jgi:hypothetical protein
MSPLICWLITGAVLLLFAGLLGRTVRYSEPDGQGWKQAKPTILGILIDDRKRYSLAHFQLVAWGLVLTSLVAAVALARLLASVAPGEVLNFTIPPNLLVLAGLAGGSSVLATAVKASKDTAQIQAKSGRTQFRQMFMVEEGVGTDSAVDPTKFQNFVLTVIAIAVYSVMAGSYLAHTDLSRTGAPNLLPDVAQGLLYLIGISQGAYVGAKIPNRAMSDDPSQRAPAAVPEPAIQPVPVPAITTAPALAAAPALVTLAGAATATGD